MATYTWSRETRWFKSLCPNPLDAETASEIGCPVCVNPVDGAFTGCFFLNDVSAFGSPSNPKDIRRYGTGSAGTAPRMYRDDSPSSDFDHTIMRFENVTLDQGTVLTEALIYWTGTLDVPTGIIPDPNIGEFNVYCEDADDASELPTGDDVSDWNTLTKTTASSSGTADTDSGLTAWTLDITSAVNEVLARPGWVNGNAINVMFETDLSNGSATWVLNFNYDTTTTPKLCVE
jgi:hypothetical protein